MRLNDRIPMVVNEIIINFIWTIVFIQCILMIVLLWIISTVFNIFILFIYIASLIRNISCAAWRLDVITLSFDHVSHVWSTFKLQAWAGGDSSHLVCDAIILDQVILFDLEIKVAIFLILKLLLIDRCHQVLRRSWWPHSSTLLDSSHHLNILRLVFLLDLQILNAGVKCIHMRAMRSVWLVVISYHFFICIILALALFWAINIFIQIFMCI